MLHVASDFRDLDWAANAKELNAEIDKLIEAGVNVSLLDTGHPFRNETRDIILNHDNLAITDFRADAHGRRGRAPGFGDVDVGSNKIKSVKVINAGKVKKKKVPLPILIEMEAGATNPFTVTQACDDDDLGPKSKGVAAGSCEVSVTFMPTAAMKYKGTLTIDTNLESKPDRTVKLEGAGKAPKK